MNMGNGGGSVGTNTAFGTSALAANTTGANGVGIGYQALKAVTTGEQNTAIGSNAAATATTTNNLTAVGYSALTANTSGSENAAVGSLSLFSNTTGLANSGIGHGALYANTTGSYNTAIGRSSLSANTTASNNTAVGYQAAYANETGTRLVAVGWKALNLTTVSDNVAVGYNILSANTTGAYNSAFGPYDASTYSPLNSNTTGSNNTALGAGSLAKNTTASNNTAVGYQAGYSNSTGAGQAFFGFQTGYSATGGYNTFIGNSAGYYVTSGTKNTILGRYDGNQGGLDIRTLSNYIVFSDGDGNPRGWFDNNGYLSVPTRGYFYSNTGSNTIYCQAANTAGADAYITLTAVGVNEGGFVYQRSSSRLWAYNQSAYSNGCYLTTTGTSWTANSDERLKDIIEPITDAANKVSSLRAVIGKYKTDDAGMRRAFLIAQDVQAVLPEAVTVDTDEQGTLGVTYTEVIPLLVAAIKELKAEIDILKGQQ
jgi:hypothetical protein